MNDVCINHSHSFEEVGSFLLLVDFNYFTAAAVAR